MTDNQVRSQQLLQTVLVMPNGIRDLGRYWSRDQLDAAYEFLTMAVDAVVDIALNQEGDSR